MSLRKTTERMKAIVRARYGLPDPEVLQFKDVERPNPTDDEVLIKVQAASVNRYPGQGRAQGKSGDNRGTQYANR